MEAFVHVVDTEDGAGREEPDNLADELVSEVEDSSHCGVVKIGCERCWERSAVVKVNSSDR